MTTPRIDRRAVLKGIAGSALVLPRLEAMGEVINAEQPRRFCALYTANGMSLPKAENGIDQWSWFPMKAYYFFLNMKEHNGQQFQKASLF